MGNNFRGNNIKVSYLPHSQVHKNLFQTITEFFSLFSCELIRRPESRQHRVVCTLQVSTNSKKEYQDVA